MDNKHTTGLDHLGLFEDNNMMIKTKRIKDTSGDPSKATYLKNEQIREMQQKYIRIVICFLIFVCLSCQNKNKSTTRIDVKYQNYSIETVAGPKWDEVINGIHPEFLVESSIINEKACDSIICLVSNLKPMKAGTIPNEFKPYMQCIIHFADGHSSVLLLGEHYNTLDSVAMMDNDILVQMIRKYSGYNHPKTY